MNPSPPRGPPGEAPAPPPLLASIALPLDRIETGVILHRIHRLDLAPVFFSPGPGNPPTHRFDCASGRFGILYAGMNLAGALAETILRNPQRRMVAASEIAARAATGLVCRRALRVVTLHGPGLQMVGTNNAISTGPYNPCGLWSDALWDHANQPDGIAYRSRHDSSEICLALFERPGLELEVLQTRALAAMPREIGAMLDRYGKSLIPAPD